MPRALGRELEQQATERIGLVLVESRRTARRAAARAGRGTECARASSTSRGGAGGERVDLAVGHRADSDLFQQVVGELDRVVALRRPAPPHLEPRRARFSASSEAAERLEPLKGTGDAEPGAHMTLDAGDVGSGEGETWPAVGCWSPVITLKSVVLPRAVRADEPRQRDRLRPSIEALPSARRPPNDTEMAFDVEEGGPIAVSLRSGPRRPGAVFSLVIPRGAVRG